MSKKSVLCMAFDGSAIFELVKDKKLVPENAVFNKIKAVGNKVYISILIPGGEDAWLQFCMEAAGFNQEEKDRLLKKFMLGKKD